MAKIKYLVKLFAFSFIIFGVTACEDEKPSMAEEEISKGIVPEQGYAWPEKEREYWPTETWQTALPENHGINPADLEVADKMAAADPHFRSLLIIKDGYLVFEKYYNGGGPQVNADIWSATKAFSSALIGIALDQGFISDVNTPMATYLPDYPAFGEITLRHVLTQTTGLEWSEEGDIFVNWITSADWIAQALKSKRIHPPGERLLYSSGNSHFLSGLLKAATGDTPAAFAEKHLFNKIGIQLEAPGSAKRYSTWEEFLIPQPGIWKRDAKGLEIGAVGLSVTAQEMAKFGFLYLNKGHWAGEALISESWVEESTRDYKLRNDNWGFGYQWVVTERAGHLTFNADGWGGQIICVVPDLDMVVVLKSNSENPQSHDYYATLTKVIEAASKN